MGENTAYVALTDAKAEAVEIEVDRPFDPKCQAERLLKSQSTLLNM
ncbi:MAG: hypothetical protein R3C26_22405 [Calditrichia bacterium]